MRGDGGFYEIEYMPDELMRPEQRSPNLLTRTLSGGEKKKFINLMITIS